MNTNYASFLRRFAALIVDAILIGCLQAFIFVPILAAIGISFAGNMETMDVNDPDNVAGMVAGIMAAAGAYWLLATTIQVLYFTFMESSKYQATVGKMVMGIKVTDLNGAKIEFSKALVRSLSRLISGFIFLIGYIMAAFTEKKQALHDIIAGTLVVKP